jgi:hypothetical protein
VLRARFEAMFGATREVTDMAPAVPPHGA